MAWAILIKPFNRIKHIQLLHGMYVAYVLVLFLTALMSLSYYLAQANKQSQDSILESVILRLQHHAPTTFSSEEYGCITDRLSVSRIAVIENGGELTEKEKRAILTCFP